MELRHLRYFLALAESQNFTRAAERVHVTQSTLSHQIRQLEEEIGQALFDRGSKSVTLTDAGETFLVYATRALREVDQGLGELKTDPAAMTGSVRIGTTHTFNLGFIPDAAARFLEQYATVQVIVEELAADVIVSRLESGSLDFGVAYRPDSASRLAFEPLYNEELLLAVASTHPLANRRRIRMIELHREPLVLLPSSFSTRRLLDECFRAVGAQPKIVAEMNAVAAMLSIVARTRLGTIVSASAITSSSSLRTIPLESPTPVRTPGLLFNTSRPHSRPARAFAALLRKQATGQSRQAARRQASNARAVGSDEAGF